MPRSSNNDSERIYPDPDTLYSQTYPSHLTTKKEKTLYSLSWFSVRLFGFAFPILLFFSFGILSMTIGIIVGNFVGALLMILLGLPSLILSGYILAVSIWRIGRWLKTKIHNYWHRQTPPFERPIRSDFDTLRYVTHHIFPHFGDVTWPFDLEQSEGAVSMGLAQLVLGYILYIIAVWAVGFLMSQDILTQLAEIEFTRSTVSLPAGVLSVLLGGIIGIGTLFLASIFNLKNAILILIIFIPTASFWLPTSMNLMIANEGYIQGKHAETTPYKAVKSILIEFVVLAMSCFILVFIAIYLFDMFIL